MARASKPVAISNKHFTKKEKATRMEAEKRLKSIDEKVYTPPLKLNEVEKDIYLSLVDAMSSSSILCDLDIELLCVTANSIFMMDEADKQIKENGILLKRTNGEVFKNPACAIYKDYQSIFHQCCLQLGLSPSSRAKLACNALEKELIKEDPVLSLIGGGN